MKSSAVFSGSYGERTEANAHTFNPSDDRQYDLVSLEELVAEKPSEETVKELLRTLDDLNARQQELVRLNRELEDTNRGVVALYAELDERADHLRRADEVKTRFLSNMTHEFRTPVNSILALVNLLADRLGAGGEQKDEIYYIRKSAQQLSDLVNDLLDLAKVEAGKIEVRPASFEVTALFGALRGMLRPLLVNRATIRGFIISDHMERTGAFLQECVPLVRSGRLRHREDIVDGLDAAPKALAGLLEGQNFGKLIIRVSSEPARSL